MEQIVTLDSTGRDGFIGEVKLSEGVPNSGQGYLDPTLNDKLFLNFIKIQTTSLVQKSPNEGEINGCKDAVANRVSSMRVACSSICVVVVEGFIHHTLLNAEEVTNFFDLVPMHLVQDWNASFQVSRNRMGQHSC